MKKQPSALIFTRFNEFEFPSNQAAPTSNNDQVVKNKQLEGRLNSTEFFQFFFYFEKIRYSLVLPLSLYYGDGSIGRNR